MRYLTLLLVVFLAACGNSGSSSGSEKTSVGTGGELTPVGLQLNWYPEAEHGGFYTALIKGYYEEAGLDVTIKPGGPNIPIIQIVGSGQSEFGICNADEVVTGRSNDANLVALLAPLQMSPRCIMVHSNTGIDSFEDIKNVTLAMEPSAAFAQYVSSRVALENVRIVSYAGVAPFAVDRNYAMQGYVFSEPFVAREAGAEPEALMVSDLGFNPYTSLLVTTDAFHDANPGVVQAITQASVRGWKEYLSDPDETNEYIHGLNEEMGLDILAYGVEQIRDLAVSDATGEKGFGWMTTERWQTMVSQLEELDLIERGSVNVGETFTTRYLAE